MKYRVNIDRGFAFGGKIHRVGKIVDTDHIKREKDKSESDEDTERLDADFQTKLDKTIDEAVEKDHLLTEAREEDLKEGDRSARASARGKVEIDEEEESPAKAKKKGK